MASWRPLFWRVPCSPQPAGGSPIYSLWFCPPWGCHLSTIWMCFGWDLWVSPSEGGQCTFLFFLRWAYRVFFLKSTFLRVWGISPSPSGVALQCSAVSRQKSIVCLCLSRRRQQTFMVLLSVVNNTVGLLRFWKMNNLGKLLLKVCVYYTLRRCFRINSPVENHWNAEHKGQMLDSVAMKHPCSVSVPLWPKSVSDIILF